MAYACSAWEFAAGTCTSKLQRLRNRVPRTIGYFSKRTPTRELDVAFNIPFTYDFIYNVMQAANKRHTKQRKCICLQHRNRRSHIQPVQEA